MEECGICYEDYDKDDLEWLYCAHTICSACLSKIENNKCPFCRFPLDGNTNSDEGGRNTNSPNDFNSIIREFIEINQEIRYIGGAERISTSAPEFYDIHSYFNLEDIYTNQRIQRRNRRRNANRRRRRNRNRNINRNRNNDSTRNQNSELLNNISENNENNENNENEENEESIEINNISVNDDNLQLNRNRRSTNNHMYNNFNRYDRH